MIFSSIPFMYYFLPIVLLLYFIVPKKLRNLVLLLASLFFYAWGELRLSVLMVATITLGYVSGLLVEKTAGKWLSKFFLILSTVISLGVLGYFKYANFFLESISSLTGTEAIVLKVSLPIGISFYTFQVISYVIDVYRGHVKAQRNFIDMAAYIAMFPQLIAGPIVRYSDIEGQLKDRPITSEKLALGARRFVVGLGKKVLIANTLGALIKEFNATDEKTVLFYWLYAIACTLQIYFDFSGYSDMAIGLGKILGFDFPENFNYPYVSTSITEFWRRWHMSLGTWFRDYVYIPMGGNRVKKLRWFFNILVVWALTGLWHGAAWNFVAWGLFMAFFLILEKLFLLKPLQKSKVLSHFYTMILVIISFVIFDSATMGQAFEVLKSMFGFGGLSFANSETLYFLRSYAIIFIVGIIFSMPFVRNFFAKAEKKEKAGKVLAVLETIFLAFMILLVTAYLIDGSFNPFLYFRF
ncbi:MAG: MBOAT family protein [Lachnospiraceae bacterium]|nr:MBOAT family protein [Lachnospiraceae bacterium]